MQETSKTGRRPTAGHHARALLRPMRAPAWLLAAGFAAAGSSPAVAELKVVATIKPIHALVAQVMAGVGEPQILVSGAASPHSFALKPSHARALAEAALVFRVSETVEPFTRKALAALPETTVVITLADASGVELLAQRRGQSFDAHDHAHDHAHGSDGHAGETRPPRPDGHIWLDPANAKAMVAAIEQALAKAEPDQAALFKANAAAATARLDKLEADIAVELAPVKLKPFVVFHDAYQYFEHRFGLAAVGAITVSPDMPPSAKRLSEIRERLARLDAACVFAEPNTSSGVVAAVMEGTSARAGVLDPEGLDLAPGPDAYETLLRRLAKSLRDCLER